jgi:survival-of-motor-neuron-related-splicing factor 30
MDSDAGVIEKLNEYEQQLQQVNQLLEADTSNEQLIQVKKDLEKVIELTRDLLQYQDDDNLAEGGEDDEDGDDDNEEDERQEFLDSQQKRTMDDTNDVNVGDIVEVIGGDRVYAAVITDVLNESEIKLKYYEFDIEVQLPISTIQRIAKGSMKKEDVVEGLKCQCKFSQDQTYYDCIINQVTNFGAKVTYIGYGNSEEVPIEYLKPGSVKQKKKASSNANANAASIIKIPEYLKILPTDTEQVSII